MNLHEVTCPARLGSGIPCDCESLTDRVDELERKFEKLARATLGRVPT